MVSVLDYDLHLRINGGAIGLDSSQFDIDPVIRTSWIAEDADRMGVGRDSAPHLDNDVLVPAILEIGKRDGVRLVQLSGAGGSRNIDKRLAPLVAQQDIGH